MYSRDPVATLTILSAEQAWYPTVPDHTCETTHAASNRDQGCSCGRRAW